jgi:hypothetical protein
MPPAWVSRPWQQGQKAAQRAPTKAGQTTRTGTKTAGDITAACKLTFTTHMPSQISCRRKHVAPPATASCPLSRQTASGCV